MIVSGIHGRQVTTHGLALNCDTDMTWFEHIVPCGLTGKKATSVTRQVGRRVTTSDVTPVFLDAFADVFNAQFISES